MREIEYFYSAHSAYAYLGSRRLSEICDANGARLIHRPFDLSPVVEASGAQPFAARSRTHINYYFGREIERWSEMRGVPILDHRPTHHDNPLTLPNGFLIAAAESGSDVDGLAHAVLEAHWRDDADIADAGALAKIAAGAGFDPASLLTAAISPDIQTIHEENGEEAKARGVLGSPTYFLDGEMFYGQDRLEMLERALTQPFSPPKFVNP